MLQRLRLGQLQHSKRLVAARVGVQRQIWSQRRVQHALHRTQALFSKYALADECAPQQSDDENLQCLVMHYQCRCVSTAIELAYEWYPEVANNKREYLTSWRVTLFGPNIQLHGLEPLHNVSLIALQCSAVQVLPNLSSLSTLEPLQGFD